ncbi:hypothetical protein [Helicobacter rodentium]|nr:hypothetical protein [Helicobacter rodentium]
MELGLLNVFWHNFTYKKLLRTSGLESCYFRIQLGQMRNPHPKML